MQHNHIGYVLNASNTCPRPDFIPEARFLRVPVNDSFCEKILPWLDRSLEFIGQSRAFPLPTAPCVMSSGVVFQRRPKRATAVSSSTV